jgi:hypothetical protein
MLIWKGNLQQRRASKACGLHKEILLHFEAKREKIYTKAAVDFINKPTAAQEQAAMRHSK